MQFKRCSKCRAEKPTDHFCRDRRRKSGLQPQCRECQSSYRKENRERILAGLNAYYRVNASAFCEKTRARRKENLELIRAREAEYYEKHRESRLHSVREYRHKNRGILLARARLIRQMSPEKFTEYQARREALKLRATPKWADPVAIRETYKKAAQLTRDTGELFTVDHIVPLRSKWVCGLHWEGNLQILLMAENAAKGNRWWPEELAA